MNIILFTVVYILIVLGELYLVNYYIKNIEKEDELTEKEQDEINTIICKEIKKRLEKLKTMSFKDWIQYNRDNIEYKYKDKKYYVYIFEKNDDTYLVRVNFNDVYSDLGADVQTDFIRQQSTYFSSNLIRKERPREQDGAVEWYDGCGIYSYVFVDQYNNNAPIIKTSLNKSFKKEENGNIIDGIIGSGYTKIDINDQTNYYFDVITNNFLIILFIFVYLIITITYYITDTNNYESLFLFIILNCYSISSLLAKDVIDDAEYENKLTDQLNSSILGISFLVAANIFVIQSLKNEKKFKILYNETAFLFCCSLIALMIAMFKVTDFKNARDIKTHRIQNQIFFNLSILLNIFLFLNYFLYISNEKIVSVLPNTVKNFLSFFNKQKGKKA
jgi:putative Mn2+ efflux pump MntP